MVVEVNGKPLELPEGASLGDLLERLELAGRRLALERNRQMVPRRLWAETRLCDCDRVEIVQFVGGG